MPGKVYFVGAGPGALDLLTIRAFGVLQRADVVLHDDLVPKEVVELLSPDVLVVNVGKRCGKVGMTQAAVNQRMTNHANEGKRVVRLKCGDPALFGRLGEEIEALRLAGVPFEIVPGVTAATAAAAAAQVTLTQRNSASQVVFAPGTLAGGCRQDWHQIVRPNTTLVIYMPGTDYVTLAGELAAAGIRSTMPCAIVSRAGGSGETIHITTLAELSHRSASPSPSLLILGDVVKESAAQESVQGSEYGVFPRSDRVLTWKPRRLRPRCLNSARR